MRRTNSGSHLVRPASSGLLTSAKWIKSSFSLSNGHCVEVASLVGSVVAVRDRKDQDHPVLRFAPDEWHAFLDNVCDGK